MGNSTSTNNTNDGETPTPRKPSYYSMIKNSYQALVHAIIRPPRSLYDLSKLGPRSFQFCGKNFKRTDFNLVNPREQRFCCSLWEPEDSDRSSAMLPCVIYMHGNSSSRLEGLSALSLVLGMGATMLAFDFSGSGHSDGEYVSLGAYEKDDLQCVIEYLRATGSTSTIALWGRSMGAATALLHGERDPSIAAMVLDSAFSSLVTLSEEMVELGRKQGIFAPGFLVRMAIQFIRSSVQKTANFDICKLTPIESADKCFIPALFVAAEDDHFVSKTHSEAIYAQYGGDKNLVLVEGDHNSARPRFLYDSIGIFLTQTLQLPVDWALPDAHNYIRRLPWSHSAGHGGYTASVTAVGSRHHHAQHPQSPKSTPTAPFNRKHTEKVSVPSAQTTAATTATGSGSMEPSNEMSFDELLALSIALNEEENESEFADSGAAAAVEGDVFRTVFDTEYENELESEYGDDFEFEDADTELAMQQSVQNSVTNFLSGGAGSSGATGAAAVTSSGSSGATGAAAVTSSGSSNRCGSNGKHPLPPVGFDVQSPLKDREDQSPQPIHPAESTGSSSARDPSSSSVQRSVLVNPITKKAHTMGSDDVGGSSGRVTPAVESAELSPAPVQSSGVGPGESDGTSAVLAWTCSTCQTQNAHSGSDTCIVCGVITLR